VKDIVSRPMKRGANANLRNNTGYSALMLAAQEGQIDIVKAFLSAGADRTLRNKKREAASEVALASGHPAIAQLLR
jgi:ankyrin repeat protein